MKLLNEYTLLENINAARNAGFRTEFSYKQHHLLDRNAGSIYGADQCYLEEFARHEGMTDPGDSTILFLIETFDGNKGFLSSPYGIHADEELMDFVMELRNNSVKELAV